MSSHGDLEWIRVARSEELPEGRVMTVTARVTSICLSHCDGRRAAMENRCPHQGGPLGEGSIERGADGQCWIWPSPTPSPVAVRRWWKSFPTLSWSDRAAGRL